MGEVRFIVGDNGLAKQVVDCLAALDRGAVGVLDADATDCSSEPAPKAPELTEAQQAEVKRQVDIRKRIADGETLYASDGVGYVASHVNWHSLTLRRAIPKVRGQAERKALKRERQRTRNRQLRRQGEAESRDGRAGGFDSSQGEFSAEGL